MSSRASLQTLVALAIFAGCADDSGITTVQPQDAEEFVSESPWDQRSPLRVMSRNLYLGGDIGPILDASNPADIPLLVAQTWATIRATDFPQRAQLIAQEIAAARPDVIGLQEVALFRTQSPGDFLVGNPQPAEEVAFDYSGYPVERTAASRSPIRGRHLGRKHRRGASGRDLTDHLRRRPIHGPRCRAGSQGCPD